MAMLGSINRKLDTANFQGGVIVAFMGNVEMDLRRAVISNPGRSATVEVRATFGAVKIRIPETWRVSMPASSILGNIEDKTIPPTTGTETPWLVITGYSALSSVEIEN
jgi:predicted membrane protein